jgi:GR25 family glycosyltransferase involved in LPS biosynthesis
MVDIYSIPLYYISFGRKDTIENYYREYGFTNVHHFEAVNGKKLNPENLVRNRQISISTYDRLKLGKRHWSEQTFGGIGCSLSHYNIWKICVENDWPYIIVAEDDNVFTKEITPRDVENISNVITRQNGLFASCELLNFEIYSKLINSTAFYIISNEACRTLIKSFYPIDLQVDWYISHMATHGHIDMDAYPMSTQDKSHPSSIQTFCFNCILPRNNMFYMIVIVIILAILFAVFYYRRKYISCYQRNL